VLAALGARYDPLTGCFQPPEEATFRRVLEALDAAALQAAVGSWLAARRQGGARPSLHAQLKSLPWRQVPARTGAVLCRFRPAHPAAAGGFL
jgi:hypothetical protein